MSDERTNLALDPNCGGLQSASQGMKGSMGSFHHQTSHWLCVRCVDLHGAFDGQATVGLSRANVADHGMRATPLFGDNQTQD
ncbi:MAG: hypothetical protein ACPG6X_01170 [Synechococcus sp.]